MAKAAKRTQRAKVEPPPCSDCGGKGQRLIPHSGTRELHRVMCACQYDDLPLKLVYQADDSGCMIAAVATAVGKSYAEIRRLVNPGHDFSTNGIGIDAGVAILDRLGYAVMTRYGSDPRRGGAPRDPWPCAPWADVHICMVRNLSNTGTHVVVLLKDGRVLDPWWGVVQGLHRYDSVMSIMAIHRVRPESSEEVPRG